MQHLMLKAKGNANHRQQYREQSAGRATSLGQLRSNAQMQKHDGERVQAPAM